MTNHFDHARYAMVMADLYGEEHPPWEDVVTEVRALVEGHKAQITTYEQGIVAMLTGKSASEYVSDVDMFQKLSTIGQDDRSVAYRVLHRKAGTASQQTHVRSFQVALHRLRTAGTISWHGHGDYRLNVTA